MKKLSNIPLVLALLGAGSVLPAGCENDENRSGTHPEPDAAVDDDSAAQPSVTAPGFLRPFTAPPANPGGAAVLLTISGESLATEGFVFPPAPGQEVKFVDGWEVKFERLLVTVADISLAENPDTDPNDPKATGAIVARATGPWAVDLAKDDPSYPSAKGGEGRAIALAALTRQNQKGGAAFDTAGARYALGYSIATATANAMNVNLGPAALGDYEAMIREGCTTLYVGTAQWKGDQGGNVCVPAPGNDAVLDALPKRVAFSLCLKVPAEYVNCQNPDNDPAGPLGGEEHQRGIAFKDNTFTTAQITLHPDHAFWTSVEEDAPAAFDQLAAAAKVDAAGATVTMAELAAVDYQAIEDRSGAPIRWRNCVQGDFTPPSANMSFFSGSVQNVGPSGDPKTGLRHLADFITYVTSTQGHLNADGVCAVRRKYESPN